MEIYKYYHNTKEWNEILNGNLNLEKAQEVIDKHMKGQEE